MNEALWNGPCWKEGRWGPRACSDDCPAASVGGQAWPCVSPGSLEEPDLQEAGGRAGVDRGVDTGQCVCFRASACVAVGLAGQKSRGQTSGLDAQVARGTHRPEAEALLWEMSVFALLALGMLDEVLPSHNGELPPSLGVS